MKKGKLVHYFIIGTFVSLYLAVSVISTLHVIKFFELSNPYWLSVSLAIAFELGAAASLASLIVLDKMNKALVWSLFIVLTLFQSMGNVYYAYVNLHDFSGWIELFDLVDEDVIYQKRILSMISGGILPFVALGFIKSLVDYIRPSSQTDETVSEKPEEPVLTSVDPSTSDTNLDPIDVSEQKEEQIEEKDLDSIAEGEDQSNEMTEMEKPLAYYEFQQEIESNPIANPNSNPEEELNAEYNPMVHSEPEIEIEPETEPEPIVSNTPKNDIPAKKLSPEEIETIIGFTGLEDDEDEDIEENEYQGEEIVDPNKPIPIPNRDPNQSY